MSKAAKALRITLYKILNGRTDYAIPSCILLLPTKTLGRNSVNILLYSTLTNILFFIRIVRCTIISRIASNEVMEWLVFIFQASSIIRLS